MKKEKTMSRKDFLKITGLGAIGLMAASKLSAGPSVVNAAETSESSDKIVRSPAAPVDTAVLWINTSQVKIGRVAPGVLAYYNGEEWTPSVATWG